MNWQVHVAQMSVAPVVPRISEEQSGQLNSWDGDMFNAIFH
jgi:hypothetical protein